MILSTPTPSFFSPLSVVFKAKVRRPALLTVGVVHFEHLRRIQQMCTISQVETKHPCDPEHVSGDVTKDSLEGQGNLKLTNVCSFRAPFQCTTIPGRNIQSP